MQAVAPMAQAVQAVLQAVGPVVRATAARVAVQTGKALLVVLQVAVARVAARVAAPMVVLKELVAPVEASVCGTSHCW